jgi:hypothetical protein
MNGGGLRLLAPGLTNADAIAHAIIGAARVYGDDPVIAVMTPKGHGGAGRAGRAIVAAISALANEPGDMARLARLFNRTGQTVCSRRKVGGQAFDQAELEARRAVDAASVKARLAWAAPAEPEPVAPEPVAPEPVEPELVQPEPEPELTPAPAPEPQAAPPVLARQGGLVTSFMRPAQIEARASLPVGSLSERLLAALERGPRNTQSLATELGVKETVVGQCLSALRHEKRVRSDASLGLGRALLWSLVDSQAAA